MKLRALKGLGLVALLLLSGMVFPVGAQGPRDKPVFEGTIKTVSGMEPSYFDGHMRLVEERRAGWLQRAEAAMPQLHRTPKKPVAVITIEKDAAAFQGWKIGKTQPVDSVLNRPLVPGDEFILDFGEHFAGQVVFSLRDFDIPVDAPIRLAFMFGEVLAEIAEPLDPFPASLARSWMQDEVFNFDEAPQTVRLPRRYAFRYMKISVVAASTHGKFGFADIQAEAITSADEARLLPFAFAMPEDAALDHVSLNTLRDCMQTVFEDGPKRDRRLWLGDLRLQALANYATYRNYDLVKRSLYILAGTATDKGLVATCAFERPRPMRGGNSILDYTALFAPTVLEYLEASGDRKTAEDLWPLVVKQLDFTLEPVTPEGLFVAPDKWWLFIDWHRTLDKQASEHAIVLYGLKATLALAEKLGKTDEVAFIPKIIPLMENAARRHLWDESMGMFVSGPKRELSWASQAWMVLAGVPSQEQARRAMAGVMRHANAEKPVTPYMHHYVVEALLVAGLRDEARQLLHTYWGGMLRKGADTFWEVYIPEDDFASPYKTHLMNSYCHAWSCTPTYLLRKVFAADTQSAAQATPGRPDAGVEDVLRHIRTQIPLTLREARDDRGDQIALPHPFTVPCAKDAFQQLFYWDTHFINLGMLHLGMVEQARNNTDNLLFLLDTLGAVPNANTRSMSNRSQPPFLSQMVRDLFEVTRDKEWLRAAQKTLEKEYAFWMTRRITPTGLNRYGHSATEKNLMGFHNYLAKHRFPGLTLTNRAEQLAFSGHSLAEAESGWDFNPRFDRRCMDFCPVDLNSLLYGFEQNMAFFQETLGLPDAAVWRQRAEQRRERMRTLMWNETAGCFMDYDYVNQRQGDVVSAATLFPLAMGLATPEEAARVAQTMREKLEFPHGLSTCENRTYAFVYQWDYPNGWPPMQAIAIQALKRYGFTADARRIADKYVQTVLRNFRTTGDLWEKYNVVTGTTKVSDEYPMPRMVGWTAGTFIVANECAAQPRESAPARK